MTLTVRGPGSSSAALRASSASFERSVSRMSSGTRIRGAADDAAGLVISEGLRSRVSGSAVAARNVQDGIGMLRTAEGGLAEITSMLQRARDLAVQAASGGSTNAASRGAIAAETRQLVAEIDRTAHATGSNGTRLLDGSRPQGFTFQVGADAGDTLTVPSYDAGAEALQLLGVVGGTTPGTSSSIWVPTPTWVTRTATLPDAYQPASKKEKFAVSLDGVEVAEVQLQGETNGQVKTARSYTPTQLASTFGAGLVGTGITVDLVTAADGTSQLTFTTDPPTAQVTVDGGQASLAFVTVEGPPIMVEETTLSAGTTIPSRPSLADLVAAGSGDAMTLVEDALATVLSARGELGAMQNRMEHRLSILATSGENLAAARSRLTDADMAQEHSGLVRAQLLTQVGTAMQAQGGQSAQRVLQLLSSR